MLLKLISLFNAKVTKVLFITPYEKGLGSSTSEILHMVNSFFHGIHE